MGYSMTPREEGSLGSDQVNSDTSRSRILRPLRMKSIPKSVLLMYRWIPTQPQMRRRCTAMLVLWQLSQAPSWLPSCQVPQLRQAARSGSTSSIGRTAWICSRLRTTKRSSFQMQARRGLTASLSTTIRKSLVSSR